MLGCSTIWKDVAAVAGATGNIKAYGMTGQGWFPDNTLNPLCLKTFDANTSCFFHIPYLPGTILLRLRFKIRGSIAIDGVKIKLLKRNESGTVSAWTTVGVEREFVSSTITVFTYDLPDEVMSANYSYCIVVNSYIEGTWAEIYSVGYETKKRVL